MTGHLGWKIAMILVGIFILVPIELFITYTILKKIHVDRLVWFLFWFKIPFTVFILIIGDLLKGE